MTSGQLSPASDIYGFGVICWGLMHGVSIWCGAHVVRAGRAGHVAPCGACCGGEGMAGRLVGR